jgi:hypothetical protein
MNYMRTCKRCEKIYRTIAKGSRVCDDCKKPTGIYSHQGYTHVGKWVKDGN